MPAKSATRAILKETETSVDSNISLEKSRPFSLLPSALMTYGAFRNTPVVNLWDKNDALDSYKLFGIHEYVSVFEYVYIRYVYFQGRFSWCDGARDFRYR